MGEWMPQFFKMGFVTSICQYIGVTKKLIRRRNRLEEESYIKIQANINPRKLGYTNVFILGITLVPGKDVRKIAEKLASKKEFFFVALSLGPTHSIVASCFAQDQIILNKLVEELRRWKEIEKIETNIIYEVLKSGYHDILVITLEMKSEI